MVGNEGARAASRRVGGFASSGKVARRALCLDPAKRIHGPKLHSAAGSSNFRKKSESGASSDGRSRRSLRVFSAMKARVPQAAAWEDLRAQARSRVARYVSIPPNAFTDQSFILQQEVPISGKNLSRARAATAEAGAAFEDFRRSELDLLARA